MLYAQSTKVVNMKIRSTGMLLTILGLLPPIASNAIAVEFGDSIVPRSRISSTSSDRLDNYQQVVNETVGRSGFDDVASGRNSGHSDGPRPPRPIMVRLPPTQAGDLALQQKADGTWTESGNELILQLHGKELRFVRSGATSSSRQVTERTQGGEIRGRLSHNGRPLRNCQVALIPLKKRVGSYSVLHSEERHLVTTSADGEYVFVNVPPGPYKLTWLPNGQRQWVRRVQIRPDVHVRDREVSRVKEIRTSLRTIN